MDDKSLKTLEILEELSSNGQVTQRELSHKVGIALGAGNWGHFPPESLMGSFPVTSRCLFI